MLSAITGALGLWGSLAGLATIGTIVGLILWRVRASGARAQREKQARINAKVNKEMSDEMAKPVSRDNIIERLRSTRGSGF